MIPRVVAFSGVTASGKTTIAHSLAETQRWTYASFGDVVRNEARTRGHDETSRQVLQEIGNELIIRGCDYFCKTVLEYANWKEGQGLVVDGVRHIEAFDCICKLVSPLRTILVFVRINDETRSMRLNQRKIKEELTIEEIDAHSTERQVKEKMELLANLIVDGSEPVDANIRKIRSLMLKLENII